MGTVHENKQQKQERLLETAFSLFTSKGMAKTSISDIASAAGVAKGTFYLYFRDKYDLAKSKTDCAQIENVVRPCARSTGTGASFLRGGSDDSAHRRFCSIINGKESDAAPFHQQKPASWGVFQNALHQTDTADNYDYLALFYEMLQMDDSVEWDEPLLMLYTIIELVGSTCHSIILEKNPTDLAHYKPILYRNVRSIIHNHQHPKKKTP